MEEHPAQFGWHSDDPKRIKALLRQMEASREAGHLFYAEKVGPVISVYYEVSAGWQLNLLLRSDTHWDSLHCRRDLATRHLDMITETNGLILDGGDFYDAMQGKFDPRRSYSDIRPEYLKGNKYYDNILDDLEASAAPYAKRWLLLARGNHETAVTRNINTDLTDRLADRLNQKHGGQVYAGSYGGWVRFVLLRAGRFMTTIKLRYFHGAGGGAPVTRGVIQTNRQAVFMADADIVWNGHNHNSYIIPIKRERLTNSGRPFFDLQWHIRTPGYKDAYGFGESGWEVEGGGDPKPFGGVFVNLRYHGRKVEVRASQEVE